LYYPSDKPKEVKPAPLDLKSIPTIEGLREERERRLNTAVMNPTEENMKLYLEANHFVQEKSALFADQWRRVAWQNPEYDFSARNPAANFAQVDLKNERNKQKALDLGSLSNEWGLVYFFKDNCRFCHLQSPLIKKLSTDYGFEVIAVSLDGSVNEHFPESLPDNGIGALLTKGQGIQQVPALFMVNREQTKSYLVSSGVVALEDILSRIALLGTKEPGASLFGGESLKDTAYPSASNPLNQE
ncbi:MAG: conjugal transfer protein TraF, partial [Turicimonas muris]